MARTPKKKFAGRFGSKYGKKVREKFFAIEKKQRKKQKCPYCGKLAVKRLSKGIWKCNACNKKFTGGTYFLE